MSLLKHHGESPTKPTCFVGRPQPFNFTLRPFPVGNHVNQCLRRKCQKNQVAILLSRTLHRSGIFVGFVLGFQPKSGRGKSRVLHGHGMGSWHGMGSGMGASAQIWALHGSYPRACCCCFEVVAAAPLGFSRVTMVFVGGLVGSQV